MWFDLQLPRSHDFWLGGVNMATGRETRYHLERDWWGVHFNLSRDGKLFASDGGDPTQVAFFQNGQWINLLRPQGDGAMMAQGEAGQHGEAQLRDGPRQRVGARRDLHPRRQMGGVHRQLQGQKPSLRGRGGEGQVRGGFYQRESPPMSVRHSAASLTALQFALLARTGLDADKAQVVARILTEGDLLGHTTHGLQAARALPR